ncbi:hypothetical protein GCM10010439_73480 [Actinocorallia aurantiaca]|uniref:Uncharacterized protein n=1 Tax=Actinocorallia aurantiaca TaxID=46204 RepID=A0ABN3UUK9_9ACTN
MPPRSSRRSVSSAETEANYNELMDRIQSRLGRLQSRLNDFISGIAKTVSYVDFRVIYGDDPEPC